MAAMPAIMPTLLYMDAIISDQIAMQLISACYRQDLKSLLSNDEGKTTPDTKPSIEHTKVDRISLISTSTA
jgi:hypothetical protein